MFACCLGRTLERFMNDCPGGFRIQSKAWFGIGYHIWEITFRRRLSYVAPCLLRQGIRYVRDDFGKNSRIQRKAWLDCGYMLKFLVLSASGLGSCGRVSSSCHGMPREDRQLVDLDVPMESCTWMDTNKDSVASQAAAARVLVPELDLTRESAVGRGCVEVPSESRLYQFVLSGCAGWGRDESTLMQMRVWTQPDVTQ